CCGPMLRKSSRSAGCAACCFTSPDTAVSAKAVHSHRVSTPSAARAQPSAGDPGALRTLVDVILAQWIADPILPRQNAAQGGMAFEHEAHHDVDFTFVEFTCGPAVVYAWHTRSLPRHVDLDAQLAPPPGVGTNGHQMIDHLKQALVNVIHGGYVAQVVKSQPRMLFHVAKELRGLIRRDLHLQPVIGLVLDDQLRKTIGQ